MGNTYIVLQVRLFSTRLPRKLLLPLKGISIFEHILQRLTCAKLPDGIIVATTDDTAPFISGISAQYDACVVLGSEEDVLSRFIRAVDRYSVDTVIRATGDNPLVCIEYIDRALLSHRERAADLTTFPQLPYGTGIEVISSSSLRYADARATDPSEREHITRYLYNHEKEFRINREKPDARLHRPEIRLTVDTQADYEKMKRIYNELYRGRPLLVRDVIAYLDSVEE